MTRQRYLTLMLILALLAAACGGGDQAGSAGPVSEEPGAGGGTDPSEQASVAAGDDQRPVALVVAQGGLGDDSYNDLANSGFQRGQEAAGLEGRPIESNDIVAQGEQVLRRAAQSDFGLVVDLEFTHGEILGPIAQDFSDVNWAILNTVVDEPNVASILFEEQQGSYLAGALAAMMTSTAGNPRINPDKTIGVIGGTRSTGIDKFVVGYIQGATDVDEEVEVLTSYTDDFGDPAKGRQQADAMFEQGADIVFHVAGGTGAGVIEAAADADRYAIGVDTDQDGLAPGNVLTSMIKRVDVAVETVMRDYAGGEFPGGETINLGLEEDGVGLSDFAHTADDIPQEYLDRIDEMTEQIIAGDIDVWNVIDQGYPDFYEGS